MTLRLYNTLTRRKEDFAPLDPANVRMYVCGPTVYDFAHIGNARPVIVFDVLFRLLRHLYGAEHVTYVRNITDVDDKINARAAEIAAAKGVSVEAARVEITTATARQFDEDVAALGCLPPSATPRATAHIEDMKAMIARLIEAGHAYVADPPTPVASADKSHGPAGALAKAGGHVLFDVSSKADYGKLAKRSLDEMLAGARVEVAPYKKNPMDFVLWKPSDEATPGWPSPWGRGRPGWHIECSAMGEALLGDTFDIHGGGIDLMFPHHENEIAQSESAHAGHPLARVWMHNGFLQVEGEKMSKSLGNFFTIRDLLNDWPGDVLRFAMLQKHYREPLDWTADKVRASYNELKTWAIGLRTGISDRKPVPPTADLVAVLSEDLNTWEAITYLRKRFGEGITETEDGRAQFQSDLELLGILDNRSIEVLSSALRLRTKLTDEVLHLVRQLQSQLVNSSQSDTAPALQRGGVCVRYEGDFYDVGPIASGGNFEAEISTAIEARNAARKAKNFAESDRIRDELLVKGIVLKDGPNGTTWEVKR